MSHRVTYKSRKSLQEAPGDEKPELNEAVGQLDKKPDDPSVLGKIGESLDPPKPLGGLIRVVAHESSDVEIQYEQPTIELMPAKAVFGPVTVEVGMNFASMVDKTKPFPFNIENSTYDGFLEGAIITLSILAQSRVQISQGQLDKALPRIMENARDIIRYRREVSK